MSEVAVSSVSNWLSSDRFVWIQNKALRYKNEWIVDPPGYGETRIDGMKAYLVIDFLSPTENGLVVIDWKTGGRYEDKYRKQLEGYASWASLEFDEEPARIEAAIAYLSPDYDEVQQPSSDIDVDRFLRRFRSETEEMYEFCIDIEENVPREKVAFPKTDQRVFCGGCNFRELCQDTL